MKKLMLLVLCIAVFATLAAAQTYTSGTGLTGYDKLGAHQNGGRGCVGCHAPHSGARGNGGSLQWDKTLNGGTGGYKSIAVKGDSGDDVLWGEDLGPLEGQSIQGYSLTENDTAHPRMVTGVMMCLSCHDGNVARGAMMTNQSYEATLLPNYGGQPVPTLLGADGGTTMGNYANDHPIGPTANLGALGQNIYKYFALNSSNSALTLVNGGNGTDNYYATFITNYGSPVITGARTGAGVVVENGMANASAAYVVCTTCHTPHSMYIATASASNPIAGKTSGAFPSYFFIAAPYNPGAPVSSMKVASSATQFCRQCHFKGAGGANEGSGILGVPTQF